MRRVFSNRVGILTAAIVAVFLLYATPGAHASPPLGEDLAHFDLIDPPFPLPDDIVYVNEAGETVPLAGLKGQVVLVNLWATWCAPCIREMPELDELAGAYQDKGLVVLTLSQDRGGRPVVDAFFAKQGYAHLPRALDPKGKLGRALGARGLPTTYLIDREGQVVGRLQGIAKWNGADSRALMDHYLSISSSN